MTAGVGTGGSTRQPDYRIGANGIPQLVNRRPVTSRYQRNSGMDQRNGNAPSTDPVKLNKCLYNLAVRNGTVVRGQTNGSKIESDIAIRAQYSNNNSNKSQPSTTSSGGGSSPAGGGTLLSVSATAYSGSSTTAARLGNWRSSIASSIAAAAAANCDVRGGVLDDRSRRNSLASIPRSRNCSFSSSSSVTSRTDRSTSIFNSGRTGVGNNVNGGSTLLNARRPPRRNAVEAINLSHRGDVDSGSGAVTRQCRFSAVVQKPPTAPDNRLNYQRKYDRSIFGYNRLDQFVLPPLQI